MPATSLTVCAPEKTCKKCQQPFIGKCCAPCQREAKNAWKRANPDKVKASKNAHYARHKEAIAARKATWRANNRGRIAALAAEYRRNNKEKVKAINKAYTEANASRISAAAAEAYRKNPSVKRDQKRAWLAKNPDAIRRHSHNRRAKVAQDGGKLSYGLASRLFTLQRGRCACCGEVLGDDYHLDHVMPIALGGTNTDCNMQLLKAVCNLKKHSKHPIDFMQERGFLL